jgi:hypothetical protein
MDIYGMSHSMGKIITNKKRKNIAISFVNNSLSPKAFSSICFKFANDMEKSSYGISYRLMNKGYRRLSEIAFPVSSCETAFFLIGRAYGSVEYFFELLQAQRNDLESYARSRLYKQKYIEGLFLLIIAKMAVSWGNQFLMNTEN